MRILVIDDDAIYSGLLAAHFAEHVFEFAGTAKAGVQMGCDFKPALIVSDWDLRDEVDGIAACEAILRCHPVQLIFCSGFPADDLRSAAARLRPLAVLAKPVDIEALGVLISRVAREQGSIRV